MSVPISKLLQRIKDERQKKPANEGESRNSLGPDVRPREHNLHNTRQNSTLGLCDESWYITNNDHGNVDAPKENMGRGGNGGRRSRGPGEHGGGEHKFGPEGDQHNRDRGREGGRGARGAARGRGRRDGSLGYPRPGNKGPESNGQTHPSNHNAPRGRRHQSVDGRRDIPRQRSVDRLTVGRLISFNQREPSDILLGLSHDYCGLTELLNAERQDDKIVRLTLSVLAKACQCELYPQNLNTILVKLPRSPFFTLGVQNIILAIGIDDNQQKVVLDILCILRELLVRLPGSCADQSGNLALLKKEIENIRAVSDDMEEEVVECLNDVLHLEETKLKRLRDMRHRNVKKGDVENDFPPDDYRNMSILPNMEDVNPNIKPFLRENKITGRYDDSEHYLDVQFRLLREDFIQPLRNGIEEYQNRRGPKNKRLQNIRVYENVTIVRSVCSHTDLLHRLQFDVSCLKRMNWKISKRLIYGSLVCLSSDDFKTFYVATVSDRSPELLKEGYIDVIFEHNLEEIDVIDNSQQFVMVETTAYYEAYKHVLRGLQTITNLPFERYIVQCEAMIKPPLYVRQNPGIIFDLRPLVEDEVVLRNDHQLRLQGRKESYNFSPKSLAAAKVNVLDHRTWPSAELLQLDESQYNALQTALTKEFSVIQGPPGTGKTYVGLKIVKALLHNCTSWDPIAERTRPMLIVCYTNHALDQFLSGIIKFYKGVVIRVGGRISDKDLENYSLKAHRQNARKEGRFKDLGRLGSIHREKLLALYVRIEEAGLRLDAAQSDILNEDTLRHTMLNSEYVQFEEYLETATREGYYISSIMAEWLGLGYGGQVVNDVLEDTEGDQLEDDEQDGIEIEDEPEIERNTRRLLEDEVDFDAEYANVKQKSINTRKGCIAFDISNMEKEIFPDNEGFEMQREQKRKLKRKLRQKIKSGNKMSENEAEKVVSIWSIDLNTRWRLYRYWVSQFCRQLKQNITHKNEEYKAACVAQREITLDKEKQLLREAGVIAMTTTGAARYQVLLQDVNPRIIVVEEAAEVLEGHIITSLSRGCEQLILIGDHKQLKPNPNVYKLAKQFNLEISLFERMVTNGVHCDCLELQHRMRPEISKLMKPIYPTLRDHISVEGYDRVKGIAKNIFFIKHSHVEEHDSETQSHSNIYEVRYLVELTDYLLKQGYNPKQITVLTTYSGQMFQCRKLMPKQRFDGVRVTSVDNYQGEENDIIILSLVRSNPEHNIGFLKIENRICVALSRAKIGLYVIGNFDILQSQCNLWREMTIMLRKSDEIGETLILKCQNHPLDTGIEINKPEDFSSAPAGGCQKLCNARLDCGHACVMSCHPLDLDHEEYQCQKPCSKKCKSGHPCRLKCFKNCGDCKTKVLKTIPACGHDDEVACYKDPEVHKCTLPCQHTLPCGHSCGNLCGFPHECKTKIQKTWPCGHTSKISCAEKDSVVCKTPCKTILECGHECRGTCSGCSGGRLHQACKKNCGKILVCGHECASNCSYCPPCTRKCDNECPHSKCKQTCGEVCKPCQEPCIWNCIHYQCSKKCSEPCDRSPCNLPCKKLLKACGHQCIGLCGEPCPPFCRECDKDIVTEIFFGVEDEPTARFVELRDCNHIIEYTSLDTWMNAGTSSESITTIQMKSCPKCKTPIRRSVRYGNIVNQLLKHINDVKVRFIGNRAEIETLRKRLIAEAKIDLRKYIINRNHGTAKAFETLYGFIPTCRSINELIAIENQMKFLSRAEKDFSKFEDFEKSGQITLAWKNELSEIKDNFWTFVEWLSIKKETLSEQELKDAEGELRHQRYMYQLVILERAMETKDCKLPNVKKQDLDTCKKLIKKGNCLTKLNEELLKTTLKAMKELTPTSCLGISEEERVNIVSAMGLQKGHWFNCPNGHVYAIADCGGATVEGTCPECNSVIGGTSHRLRADNSLATEMDGARHAAWSEHTNLNNYAFEGLD